MSIDLTKVSELLAVVEKCAAHGPRLNAIASGAMDTLLKINEDMRQESVEAAKQKAAAQVLAAQKAEEDAVTTDPTPVRESQTDKIAKDNMRRA
jgi:hypothetical protein